MSIVLAVQERTNTPKQIYSGLSITRTITVRREQFELRKEFEILRAFFMKQATKKPENLFKQWESSN